MKGKRTKRSYLAARASACSANLRSSTNMNDIRNNPEPLVPASACGEDDHRDRSKLISGLFRCPASSWMTPLDVMYLRVGWEDRARKRCDLSAQTEAGDGGARL